MAKVMLEKKPKLLEVHLVLVRPDILITGFGEEERKGKSHCKFKLFLKANFCSRYFKKMVSKCCMHLLMNKYSLMLFQCHALFTNNKPLLFCYTISY